MLDGSYKTKLQKEKSNSVKWNEFLKCILQEGIECDDGICLADNADFPFKISPQEMLVLMSEFDDDLPADITEDSPTLTIIFENKIFADEVIGILESGN